jgi:hypothetical protein
MTGQEATYRPTGERVRVMTWHEAARRPIGALWILHPGPVAELWSIDRDARIGWRSWRDIQADAPDVRPRVATGTLPYARASGHLPNVRR